MSSVTEKFPFCVLVTGVLFSRSAHAQCTMGCPPGGPHCPETFASSFEWMWGGEQYSITTLDSDPKRAWVCGDGGRIIRGGFPGSWSQQYVPDHVQDLLRQIFFLDDGNPVGSEEGWCVGHNGWVLHTTTGGTCWDVIAQLDDLPSNGGKAELYDVHFLDSATGWVLGLHQIWFTADGGATFCEATLKHADGTTDFTEAEAADIELYALDVMTDGETLTGLAVAEPGLVFVPQALGSEWRVVWDLSAHCSPGSPEIQYASCSVSVAGPGADCVTGLLQKFEPWDVEMSRDSANPYTLVVGGFGNTCGLILRADGYDFTSWVSEPHYCALPAPPAMPDPNPCAQAVMLCPWAPPYPCPAPNRAFTSLYGVGVFLPDPVGEDGTAIAVGYNGQHLVRVLDPELGPYWKDVSRFSAPPARGFEWSTEHSPSYLQRSADAGVGLEGWVTGDGGHLRYTRSGGDYDPSLGTVSPTINCVESENQAYIPTASAGPYNGYALAHSPADDSLWQAGGRVPYLLKSLDEGKTWSVVYPSIDDQIDCSGTFLDIAFDGTGENGVAVGAPGTTNASIIRGSYAGDWDAVAHSSTTLRAVAWEPGTGGNPLGTFWAVGDANTILRSTDSGSTWQPVAPPSGTHSFWGVAFSTVGVGAIVGESATGQGAAFRWVGTGWQCIALEPSSANFRGLRDVDVVGSTAIAVGQKVESGVTIGVVFSFKSAVGSCAGGQFVENTQFPYVLDCDSTPDKDDDSGIELQVPGPLNTVHIVRGPVRDVWVGGDCGRLFQYFATDYSCTSCAPGEECPVNPCDNGSPANLSPAYEVTVTP